MMLALRKRRMAASLPVLRGGFRPFFLGAAVWAVLALVLWLGALFGTLTLPSALDPLAWHRHEMLFGFVGAVVAGFLLTAIPNWTGRLPIAGLPLAALVGLWFAARLALLFSATLGIASAAALDIAFYLVLAAVCFREVLAAANRNIPIVGLVLLFGMANAADYAAASGNLSDSDLGFRGGIALIIMMISLIGGRIVPSFTRNWMSKQRLGGALPTQPGAFDKLTLAATGLSLGAWTIAPTMLSTAALLTGAGLLQAARLVRWRGWRTLREPLVLVLHVGYAWVPAGILLLAGSIVETSVSRTAAIHALTAGAMGTMILAVMTRASLGHTGRKLVAGPATVLIFTLVTLGAGLRVGATLGAVEYRTGLALAGGSWAGAFLLFAAAYAPILLRPRMGDI